jgi:cytochrome c peroxidase
MITMKNRTLVLLALSGFARIAIAQGPPPPPPPLQPPPIPAGNPLTAAKTNLGKTLFWDEQLSTSKTVACGTCHIFGEGGSDPRTSATNAATRNPGADGIFNTPDDVLGSPGVARQDANGKYVFDAVFGLSPGVTGRKSPSVINAAYVPSLFWDGRALPTFTDPVGGGVVLNGGAALESQSVNPPVSDVEMGHIGQDWAEITARLSTATPLRMSPQVPAQLTNWIAGRDYSALFQEAFGTPDITAVRIAMAIATYERALFSNQAPVDVAPQTLTPQEQQGGQIFATIGRCNVCHVGSRQTNDTFRYIGVRPQNDDLGRFNVTGLAADRGRMKVPSLRNVELRAPYFHNGEMATLEDVVDFYDRGGDFTAPNKDPAIAPIGLTPVQKAALVAFLKRPLTDPRIAAGQAPFDRPLLYSESALVPQHFGAGTPGGGGFVPRLIANEPPAVGNADFTLAIDRGNGAHDGILVLSSTADPFGTLFQGAMLHVQLSSIVGLVRVGPLSGVGAGNGFGSVTLPIANDPLMVGVSWYAQWFVFDLTPGSRFAASEAAQITFF